MRIERLLVPALRADADGGFDGSRGMIDAALERGVGGFILFGGDADHIRALTAELRKRSGDPLLIGADLERGAGQQFQGAAQVPPMAALGALDEVETTRWAGQVTAVDALVLGVDWVFAPVADLDAEPANPIVGTRAFGTDPEHVSRHVRAWIEGCRAAGALSCAKHFPGHGRTVTDSHLELPHVDADREVLDGDLRPFGAAIEAGVDSIMTAHVAYLALDPDGTPATLSQPIIDGMLRAEMGFQGLVVTDALIMEGVRGGEDGEGDAVVRALAAGCDVLLYPENLEGIADAVENAIDEGRLDAARVEEALKRVRDMMARSRRAGEAAISFPEGPESPRNAQRPPGPEEKEREPESWRELGPAEEEAGSPLPGQWYDERAGTTMSESAPAPIPPGADTGSQTRPQSATPYSHPHDQVRALEVARRSLRVVRGKPRLDSETVHVITIDDDVGGPYPPPARDAFAAALTEAGIEAEPAEEAPDGQGAVVALYADIRGWKGRPGISTTAHAAVKGIADSKPDTPIVLFGHPRLAEDVPGEHVLAAWGGEALMQRAAAQWLAEAGRTR